MKNTFSFRHDFGARNDPKIRKMIARLGPASGWAWWVTVEELFEQGGRMPLESICEIAYDAHVPEEMVRNIIYDFDLFKVTKKEFYSTRICFELSDKESRSSAAQKSANARWDKYKKERALSESEDAMSYADAYKTDAEADANASKTDAKIKLNKIKEIRDTDVSPSDEQPSELPLDIEKPKLTGTKQVMELWNRLIDETNAPLKKIVKLTDARKKKIQVRWREFAELGNPEEVVIRIFRNACESKFFQGDNKTGWSGSFDWLFENSKNWVKTYEGNYENRTTTNNGAATGYDRLHNAAQSAEEFKGRFYVSPQSSGNGGDAS